MKIQCSRAVHQGLQQVGDEHAVDLACCGRILVVACDDETVTPRLGTIHDRDMDVFLDFPHAGQTVCGGGRRAAQHRARVQLTDGTQHPDNAFGVRQCRPFFRVQVQTLVRHDNSAFAHTTLKRTPILRIRGMCELTPFMAFPEHRVQPPLGFRSRIRECGCWCACLRACFRIRLRSHAHKIRDVPSDAPAETGVVDRR